MQGDTPRPGGIGPDRICRGSGTCSRPCPARGSTAAGCFCRAGGPCRPVISRFPQPGRQCSLPASFPPSPLISSSRPLLFLHRGGVFPAGSPPRETGREAGCESHAWPSHSARGPWEESGRGRPRCPCRAQDRGFQEEVPGLPHSHGSGARPFPPDTRLPGSSTAARRQGRSPGALPSVIRHLLLRRLSLPERPGARGQALSLIHISEPTRPY